MKFVKLETKEQILALKKGDLVITSMSNGYLRSYKIFGLVNDDEELLLSYKRSHFFSISMYLNGKSWCKEAYLVTKEGEL